MATDGNSKVTWWIMGVVGGLAIMGVGGFTAGLSQRVSVHDATLAARGERIATLEVKAQAMDMRGTAIEARLQRIEDKMDKIAERVGAK